MFWILRYFNPITCCFVLFQQDNPAIFGRVAVTCKEKGYQVVGREVYKTGFAAIVLELGFQVQNYLFQCRGRIFGILYKHFSDLIYIRSYHILVRSPRWNTRQRLEDTVL